jgi:flagellar hook-length control protein FliK
MAEFNSADGNPAAAINSLMARLQEFGLGSAADLKTGFERMQQIIAQALAGQAPAALDGNAARTPGAILMTDQAQIYQWLKGLLPGRQDQPFNSGWSAGEGAPAAKGSGTMPTDAKAVLETMAKPAEAAQSAGGNGIFQSAENATARVPLENRREGEPAKLAPAVRSPGSENQPNPPATQAVESAHVGVSKIKETVGFLRDPQVTSRTEGPDRTALPVDPVRQADSENPRHSQPLKSSAASGMNPALVNASESQIQSTSGAEPLSKVLQENQLVKERVVKMDSGTAEATISKVIKTEAAIPDNNLFNASGHHMEKAVEGASASSESESSQSRLRNPTMDQIVHRAAILLRNGQHEARIDLKPDVLGHIRMQVISENQQVTVRILAEHGFVKDMIESNAHQLKADLQQHGLAVDKLEVTVSRDPEDPGHSREKLAQSKTRQGNAGHPNEDRPGGQQTDSRRWRPTAPGAGSVDYFA